jgi:hypothetical protein
MPVIGYDKASRSAALRHDNDSPLKAAALLGFVK